MPVELRKRKAPAPAPEPPAKKAPKATKATKATAAAKAKVEEKAADKATDEAADEAGDKAADTGADEAGDKAADEAGDKAADTGADEAKEAVKGKSAEKGQSNGPTKGAKPVVGDVITLEGFGGEVQTNEGTATTLKALVDESKSGVVLFTYPKASTPGCTTQACLFRDSYEPLTKDGLAIYGLSTDSPKSNTTFKDKQKLPYPLLCDSSATLIGAIGFKKAPKGTTRGVFAVDKAGKVLLAEAGGPGATLEAVKKLVEDGVGAETKDEPAADEPMEEAGPANGDVVGEEKAETAKED